MSVDWEGYAKKAAAALEEDGVTATVNIKTIDPDGEYNIETGKDATITTSYSTAAILKSYEMEHVGKVNPEDIEILFHSGLTPDTIPDLMDENDVTIEVAGKIYKIIRPTAIRPAAVTIMYKVQAREVKDSSE